VVLDFATAKEISYGDYKNLVNAGEISPSELIGYMKVKSKDGTPLTTQETKGDKVNEYSIFKMINLYGSSGIVAEYPKIMGPSQFNNNTYVVKEELTNEAIISMFGEESVESTIIPQAPQAPTQQSTDKKFKSTTIGNYTILEIIDDKGVSTFDVSEKEEGIVAEYLKSYDEALEAIEVDKVTSSSSNVNFKDVIDSFNLESNEYEIISINNSPKIIVLKYLPNVVKKGYEFFYTKFADTDALVKRVGKKIVIPGFENINLRLEQDTKLVYELSTGLSLGIKSRVQSDIISEIEELFISKNIYNVLQNSKKINANDADTTFNTLEKLSFNGRKIKVDQFNITIQPDGKMLFADGKEVTDQTIKNKVNIRKELQDGTLRVSTHNKNKYFVLLDGRILGSGKTNLGEETVSDPKIKEQILDKAITYKKTC
jgi:hypothetical protein